MVLQHLFLAWHVSVCFRHQLLLIWVDLGLPSHQYQCTIWFPWVPNVGYVSGNIGYVPGPSIFNPCECLIKISFSAQNLPFPSAPSLLIAPSAPFWYLFTLRMLFFMFIFYFHFVLVIVRMCLICLWCVRVLLCFVFHLCMTCTWCLCFVFRMFVFYFSYTRTNTNLFFLWEINMR